MTDAVEATGRNNLGRNGTPALAGFRLAVGLLQGAALWWLYQSVEALMYQQSAEGLLATHRSPPPEVVLPGWPASVPELFGPLAMIFVMVPVLLLAGAGRMRARTLILWIIGATAFLALLGWHGVTAQSISEYGARSRPPFLPWPMPLFAAAALFIGHHLVLPADLERKPIAAFPTYFDTAWKAGVQLALSIGFTGAFWILLFLGAALFNVIGLEFLRDLIGQEWFSIPVTCLMFATAVHLTDVRDGLIRGVRSVALMLLSWLLLLMTVLAGGFLLALPFTGLEGLWETGNATALVLAAAAALIILINTAYQDGRADNLPPSVLRVAVRVASVLLTPLVVLAFWGLALRIGQHGLTPDRIIALACAIIGAAYAAGYGFAALQPFWRRDADWMQPLERTNIWTAVLEVGVILALFSPIADPARLSVADQVARLERGAVAPDKFDYRFLRFESGKAGEAALARLTRSANPVIARSARNISALEYRSDDVDVGSPNAVPRYEVVPAGTVLPSDFAVAVPPTDDRAMWCPGAPGCVVSPQDLNGDGVPEVLMSSRGVIRVWAKNAEGAWAAVGSWRPGHCIGRPADPVDLDDILRKGQVRPIAPAWPDLEIAGVRAPAMPQEPDCAPEPAQTRPAD